MSYSTPLTSIDGLASGLNTTDIITKLMQIERQPQLAHRLHRALELAVLVVHRQDPKPAYHVHFRLLWLKWLQCRKWTPGASLSAP